MITHPQNLHPLRKEVISIIDSNCQISPVGQRIIISLEKLVGELLYVIDYQAPSIDTFSTIPISGFTESQLNALRARIDIALLSKSKKK